MSSGTIDSSPGVGELFQILRDGLPRTRADLVKSTGLARSTVAARVEDLLRTGLVTPIAESVSTGGRPSTLFALNPRALVVLAADVGASHTTIALSDLSGDVLAQSTLPIAVTDGPARVLGWIVEQAHELLAGLGRPAKDIAAIGIGLPGPVEHATGQPVNPPIMPGWDRFDVPGWVHNHFDAPVLVDNDANVMALGERAVAWPGVDDLLFVKVATGIGAGVISAGALLRGSQGVAGDIGHVRVARAADVPCQCGNRGCLEALASGPAVARHLRTQGVDAETTDDVVELVRRGNIDAIQAVRQAGRDIGEVLTTCVSLMNPSVIAIGGSLSRVGEHLVAGVREMVYTRSTPLATGHLSVAPSHAADNAGVVGASILAIDHVLSPKAMTVLATRR